MVPRGPCPFDSGVCLAGFDHRLLRCRGVDRRDYLSDISLNTQLALFIGSSVLSLLFLRRWLKGVFLGHEGSRQDLTLNLDDFVGQRAVVREKILPKLGGKVEFHGTNWEARADEEIAAGTVVEIVEKNNITLRVKAV